MFKVCVKFDVLPQQCKNGILVPLLKKTTLDPTVPNSYRPFTVSCIISKILEHFILDECEYKPCDAQFGFVEGRSSGMATVLAHNVGAYCAALGSPTFYWNLDVQRAFDDLPHCIIL